MTVWQFTRLLTLSGALAICVAQETVALSLQVPDEDTIAILPRSRWPQAPASARPRDTLRTLPPTYWASALLPGEVQVIDGVISARQPSLSGPRRIRVAGIPEDQQPSINLEGIRGDTGDARRRVRAQTAAFLDWSARHHGRQLPAPRRTQLAAMYRAVADTAGRIAARRVNTAADAERVRGQLARLMGRALIRERDLFQGHPQAQRDRFGRARQRSSNPLDTATFYRAIEHWMAHDFDSTPPAPRNLPRRLPFPGSSRRLAIAPAREMAISPAFQIACGGNAGDTVVTTRQVDDWHALPVFEARVYEMSHQAIEWISDIMEEAGVDTDWFYHAGIGAGMFQLFKTHHVKTTRVLGSRCDSTIQNTRLDLIQQLGTVIRVDTTTAYDMLLIRWEIANGSAGDYRNNDEKRLVHRAQFDTWDEAYKYLYTPTPTAGDGKYYKIRAVAYSVGDYGSNWTCQTSSNAFTLRRWGFTTILNPSGAWLYGLYGNRGISERIDMFGGVHYGCVPGRNCFYNLTPPYATGVTEPLYDGIGWGLDVFWNPRQGHWAETLAAYTAVAPPWGSRTERVYEVPGWQ